MSQFFTMSFGFVVMAALVDIMANMALTRSKGFKYKGWGHCGDCVGTDSIHAVGTSGERDRLSHCLCLLGCDRYLGYRSGWSLAV